MYNVCAKTKIAFDKWTIMDTLSAVLNVGAVGIITYLQGGENSTEEE
jgi:hypothetical protein